MIFGCIVILLFFSSSFYIIRHFDFQPFEFLLYYPRPRYGHFEHNWIFKRTDEHFSFLKCSSHAWLKHIKHSDLKISLLWTSTYGSTLSIDVWPSFQPCSVRRTKFRSNLLVEHHQCKSTEQLLFPVHQKSYLLRPIYLNVFFFIFLTCVYMYNIDHPNATPSIRPLSVVGRTTLPNSNWWNKRDTYIRIIATRWFQTRYHRVQINNKVS
jgi:hypothetical protein